MIQTPSPASVARSTTSSWPFGLNSGVNQRPPGGVSGRMPVPSELITSSWVLSGKSRSNTICEPSGDQEA